MCGRYLYNVDEQELRNILEAIERNISNERNNPKQSQSISFTGGEIFPGDSVPVITAHETRFMIWGYPSLAEDRRPHINARSETVATKRTFSAAMAARRCIIPASSYYEWKTLGKKQKQKYEFKLPNTEIMYIAGIYSLDYQFAILTREATTSISEIHNRMPVIIPDNLTEMWLKGCDDVLQEATTNLIFEPVGVSTAPASSPPSLEDEHPTQLSLFS